LLSFSHDLTTIANYAFSHLLKYAPM
jgi:hypothetical protein